MQRVAPFLIIFLNFQFVAKNEDALVIKFSEILIAEELKACLVSSSFACNVEWKKKQKDLLH